MLIYSKFDFSGVKEIGNRAFEYDSIETVFSDTLEKIGDASFWENNQIQSLIIPESVKDIGAYAFARCTNLQSVNIPNNELKLFSTFEKCNNLQIVSIPENIVELSNTFLGCTRLQKAVIYGKQISIPYYGIDNEESAFYGCTRLACISGYTCSTIKQYYDSLPDEQKGKISFEALDQGQTITHEWIANKVTIKEPTCTENGIKARKCNICGLVDEDTQEEIPAWGHDWNNGVITKEPTETEEGIKTYTCWRCGETKVEVIPKLSAIQFNIS